MHSINAIKTAFQEQRQRWFLWIPVPVALGIAGYFSLTFEPPLFLGMGALAALMVPLLIFHKNRNFLYIWLIFFLVVLGFTAAQCRTAYVASPVLQKKAWGVTIQGRVIDVQPMVKSYRIVLDKIDYMNSKLPQKNMPTRVRIRMKKKDKAVPVSGDIVQIRATLLPLSQPTLPHAFDFQRYAYFKGLGSTGYALSELTVITAHNTKFFFEDLRRTIRRRVAKADVADKDTNGLITAFIIGDSKSISDKDWDIARRSGIAHLIAISGSHFVLVVGIVFFFIRGILAAFPYIALRWPLKKIAAVAGMFSAVFYMFLIGAPITAQRATIMACIILFATLIDRDAFTLRIAAIAAVLVLLIEPESLIGASFQLSFAAVVGLISFFESTRGTWQNMHRAEGYTKKIAYILFAAFISTTVAGIATAPFALYHFSQTPFFAGMVANMIAVPLSSFITFPAGLLACLLMPFGLEKAALWVMARSIEIIMSAAETIANWPHMMFHTDAWPITYLAILALGGLWLCLWEGRMRWFGIIPIVITCILIPLTPRPDVIVGGKFRMLAAVHDPQSGKLWLSPGRHEGFVRRAWIEREGSKGNATWPEEEGIDPFLICEGWACTYRAKGKQVLLIDDDTPTPKECATVDIIVTPTKKMPKYCRGKKAHVIDKWDLYFDGSHAIYLNEGKAPVVESIFDVRGKRPWTGRVKKY